MTDPKDGPPPVDDDVEDAKAAARRAMIEAHNAGQSTENTSLGTLIGIGIVGAILGASLIIWGLVAASSYGSGYPVQKDTGSSQLAIGSGLFSVGITALLILAGVRAVIWHLDHPKKSDPTN